MVRTEPPVTKIGCRVSRLTARHRLDASERLAPSRDRGAAEEGRGKTHCSQLNWLPRGQSAAHRIARLTIFSRHAVADTDAGQGGLTRFARLL